MSRPLSSLRIYEASISRTWKVFSAQVGGWKGSGKKPAQTAEERRERCRVFREKKGCSVTQERKGTRISWVYWRSTLKVAAVNNSRTIICASRKAIARSRLSRLFK